MRDLTAPERQDIISANGYPDDGSGKFIEAKVSELSAANIEPLVAVPGRLIF